jgi:hypothetical protein
VQKASRSLLTGAGSRMRHFGLRQHAPRSRRTFSMGDAERLTGMAQQRMSDLGKRLKDHH